MEKRNIYVLLYDRFADFEIVLATLLLKRENLVYFGFNKLEFESETKLKVKADKLLSELNPDLCDLFIIPGGEPKLLIKDPEQREYVKALNHILTTLNQKKKKIAAICGGPTFLANSGILDGKKCTGSIQEDEKVFFKNTLFEEVDLIRDGNILTAQGQAFTDFAIEVGKLINFFEKEEDATDTLKWVKNIK
ncbi:hypothetical protein NEF87_001358 [Candidatus Lokiarchaeum ossiferum]|uniref:DJ-1/PfpI domain-containing protein n=1 Tax=Candidatus Lokiarchaeum ossiferum TaxID=2951803 RepID=A0ABY6HNH5_9ARCH|nr:hypothetical protein NEF87_001358 [Candidatus Lokiarchaeum sp. B-35]